MKFKLDTKTMVILGMLSAIVLIFSVTPIGSIPINPTLSITLNVIPVAIAAVALGPVGGAIIGGIFGIFSFLQTVGFGMPSKMGIILTEISPFLSFIQRFVPRFLDGFLLGLIFKGTAKVTNVQISCFVTGFFAAFLNTVFFMTALVLLFGNTDYMRETMVGKSALAYIIATVTGNAVFEMIASTIITGAVGFALYKAKLIKLDVKPDAPKAA